LLDAEEMVNLARGVGRPAAQRTTLYGRPQASAAPERGRGPEARGERVQAEAREAMVIEG
jgi:hypothetical protein